MMLQVKAPKGTNLCYLYLTAFVPVDCLKNKNPWSSLTCFWAFTEATRMIWGGTKQKGLKFIICHFI